MRAQVDEKKGEVVVACTLPEYPALHMQPVGTLAPAEFTGQPTGVQVDVKKGELVVAVTEPEYPGAHVQPVGTDVPVELEGQLTATRPLI